MEEIRHDNSTNPHNQRNEAISQEHSAPSYDVPSARIVEVEHPFLIQNFERALKSLGGEAQIKQIFEATEENDNADESPSASTSTLGLSLRPNDPFAKKTSSTAVSTRNILFKVTIPTRTGRKRKRGSDEPYRDHGFLERSIDRNSATNLLDTLRDNPKRYQVQAIGTIHETHRFRNPPDLQMCAAELPMMREVRDHVMQPDYASFKKFQISLKPGATGVTAFPAPPTFLPPGPHFQYGYQQHREPIRNRQKPLLIPTSDDIAVPDTPPSLPEVYIQGVENALPPLRALLRERPIITLHVACGEVRDTAEKQIEIALLYLTYYADTGPWKGAFIKYGVDPRKDAAYRVYQTIPSGHLPSTASQQTELPEQEDEDEIETPRRKRRPKRILKSVATSNIKPYILSFRDLSSTLHIEPHVLPIYQLCDISVPLLEPLLHSPSNLSETCDSRKSGWYTANTIAKIRILVREMITTMTTADLSPNLRQQREQEWGFIVRLSNENLLEHSTDAILDSLPGLESDKTYVSQLIRDIRIATIEEPEVHPVDQSGSTLIHRKRGRKVLGRVPADSNTNPENTVNLGTATTASINVEVESEDEDGNESNDGGEDDANSGGTGSASNAEDQGEDPTEVYRIDEDEEDEEVEEDEKQEEL